MNESTINKIISTTLENCADIGLDKTIDILTESSSYLKAKYEDCLNTEDDHRSGFETYGYESNDHILTTLEYISDRWCCAFRLRWLIDLIENYKKR